MFTELQKICHTHESQNTQTSKICHQIQIKLKTNDTGSKFLYQR